MNQVASGKEPLTQDSPSDHDRLRPGGRFGVIGRICLSLATGMLLMAALISMAAWQDVDNATIAAVVSPNSSLAVTVDSSGWLLDLRYGTAGKNGNWDTVVQRLCLPRKLRGTQRIDRSVFSLQDCSGIATKPVFENSGIDLAKVGVMLQISVLKI